MSASAAALASRKPSRRQALKVLAAAVALPVAAWGLSGLRGEGRYVSWSGVSLGGPAELTLWHPDSGFAEHTITRMRAEIERLEAVFSLFRADSEISRLNRSGWLDRPSPDLVAVLTAAREIAHVSGGAFDPTVQPLWRLYESHFLAHPDDAIGPAASEIAAARALVGYADIDIAAARVAFRRSGMAITLNGVAQGYITDRVADLLRNEGYDHAMVDVGETRAIGGRPEGRPWQVALENPRNPLALDRTVELADQSLSVSGNYGLRFGRSQLSHIFDPATGRGAATMLDVAVISARATAADMLSTAIFVAGEAAAPKLLAAYPGSRALITRSDGTVAAA
jgi:thiamine biosynthesis lipoprotein